MHVLLVNPPYQTITSNLGVGHQVPLGLLMVGGALADAGHCVRLLDGECYHLSPRRIAQAAHDWPADVVMTGHAGSTPAHGVCLGVLEEVKQRCPWAATVYGGVYPTYHARQILKREPAVDFIVRGEGEATAVDLVDALQRGRDLQQVQGVACRSGGNVTFTPERPPIEALDRYRAGWELIDRWDNYQCFGLGRAAVVQFSRGCPHRCTYCGQHDYWKRWRHRDPSKVADEIEWLWHCHRVGFITLADENPTTDPRLWRQLLEDVSRRRLPVNLFATIRATDIVRDEAILPLYRSAGMLYVLMGIETTSDEVLRQIRKGSTTRQDYRACQLLKKHGIYSIIGHIVGFGEETGRTFASARRQLAYYDGDYLNAMCVTPHDWTPFGAESLASRRLVGRDQARWDYRHQVLAQRHLSPLRLLLHVKWLELSFHLRPSRLRRLLADGDSFRRRQAWWCATHTGVVWLTELGEFALWALRHPRMATKPAPRATQRRITLPLATPSLPTPLPAPV